MRAKEFIIESEGGMSRRAEEAARGKRVAFKNSAGHVITITTSAVFPQDKDRADDPGQITAELMDYIKGQGIDIQSAFTLPPQGGLTTPDKVGAALVMVFQDETAKKKIAYIALKPAKKLGAYPIFLQTKLFSDLTGYVQLSGKAGEEGKISGVQQRALTNLKPVGILPANTEISVDDIPNQVRTTIAARQDLSEDIKTQVVQLLEAVAAGSNNPVPSAGDYAKSYEIDLGETAAPIALVKGKFLSGSWAAAEQGMNVSFAAVRGVDFPNDPSEKLYDSYLIVDDNTKIRVSSKDKAGGAKASVSGVVDDITAYPERYEGLFENPDFAAMLDIVKIIKDPDMSYVASSKQFKRNGAMSGVLQLGVNVGIIDDTQAEHIMSIIDSDEQYVDAEILKSYNLTNVLSYKGTDDNTRPDYRMGWHLLAAVAAGAAQTVNAKYKTDAFFKAVLERSNMIQVKTSLKQSKVNDAEGNQTNGANFSNFEVIYPPVFTGTIKLDASSNFFATRRPVGKMGFSIK